MRPNRRSRLTIGRLMALIATLALLLAVPMAQDPATLLIISLVIAFVPILFLGNVLVEWLFGIPCPGCSRWTLRRLATASSYYDCAGCGRRFKRFGLGPWLDASGPEDAAWYRGKGRSRPWVGFSIPEDHDETTTGLLLRNQRRRGRAGEKAR